MPVATQGQRSQKPGAAPKLPPAARLTVPQARASRLVTEIFKRRSLKLAPRPLARKNSLYASNIPECARQGVYEFTHWDQKTQHTWELEALFQAGKVNEEAFKAQLRDLGLELVEDGVGLPPEMRSKFNIGGYLDWRIRWEGARVPFEAKMMSPMVFDKIAGLGPEVLKAGTISRAEVERGVESMKRFFWTRKYLRQLTVYLVGLKEPVGIFALTNGRGAWKFVVLQLDQALADQVLKTARTIKRHVAAGTHPERIPYDSETCGKCPFAHVCIPDIKNDARLKLLEDAKMADLLEVRDAHLESWSIVQNANKQIAEFFEETKAGIFTIGDFMVTRKAQDRTVYEYPERVKARYAKKSHSFKNKIERISKRNPDEVFLEPRRILELGDE